MANVNIDIQMDEKLNAQAEKLLSDLGLSMTAAFTAFAKQAVKEQRIPFDMPEHLARTVHKVTVRPGADELLNEMLTRKWAGLL